MSKLSFAKFQGAGNDFILIDDRSLSFDSPISLLCDRRRGIGADGLILLQPHSEADFRMRIFNCDGKEAESCGNGLRCLLQFLLTLGLPSRPYQIATADRIVSAHFVGSQVSINMGEPHNVQSLSFNGKTLHSLNTGVPHLVLFVPDVAQIDLPSEGAHLRFHPIFGPAGTNVNFATLHPNGTLSVRTFERGLEAESMACGTGAAAVGFIAAQIYALPNPLKLFFPGGPLEISLLNGQIHMLGPATQVFQGEMDRIKKEGGRRAQPSADIAPFRRL